MLATTFLFSSALAAPALLGGPLNIFGDNEVVTSAGRKACSVFNGIDTVTHEIKKMANPANFTYAQEIQEVNRFISMQNGPALGAYSPVDSRRPEWLSVFALYNGFTYCKTQSATQMNGFALPNPEIQSPDHRLPTGDFKVTSLEDFNAYEAVNANTTQLDGRFIITTSDKHKLITLTWRGSQKANDFKADGNGTSISFDDAHMKLFGDENAVGDGIVSPKCTVPQNVDGYFMFAGIADTMQPKVMDRVVNALMAARQQNPTYSIALNGHSLGGAKSLITGFYLSKFYSKSLPLTTVYTFEQPLIGSTLLSSWMYDCISVDKIVRVVTSDDAVPWGREARNVQHPPTVIESFNPHSAK